MHNRDRQSCSRIDARNCLSGVLRLSSVGVLLCKSLFGGTRQLGIDIRAAPLKSRLLPQLP